MNIIIIKNIFTILQEDWLRAFIGPINPLIPNPALKGVPFISKMAPRIPKQKALATIGNIILGFFIKFAIWIFGDPNIGAKDNPKPLTLNPAIANPKDVAQIPKFAVPEDIPLNPTAKATPTVENGEIIKTEKILAISAPIITGCILVIWAIPIPINLVSPLTYGNINNTI